MAALALFVALAALALHFTPRRFADRLRPKKPEPVYWSEQPLPPPTRLNPKRAPASREQAP